MVTSCLWCHIVAFVMVLTLSAREMVAQDVNESNRMTAEDRLRAAVFLNYDKSAHPMVTPTEKANVTLGLHILAADIDEIQGIVTVHGWLNARWKDGALTWNTDIFDDLSLLHLRTRDIWVPQISLFNSAGRDGHALVDTQVLLFSDGSILWVPSAHFKARCELNLRTWPHDTQICKLQVGTWSMTHLDTKQSVIVDLEDFRTVAWQITDTEVVFGHTEFTNYAEFRLTLERLSSVYTATLYIPAACIVLLSLSVFWLPSSMGQKIALNAVVATLSIAFLMCMAKMLPFGSPKTPLIVLFYSTSFVLLSLSIIISVIVLYLSALSHRAQAPLRLKNLLSGRMAKMLWLDNLPTRNMTVSPARSRELLENHNENTQESEVNMDENVFTEENNKPCHTRSSDWILIATAFDRLCFWLYLIIFVVLFAVVAI